MAEIVKKLSVILADTYALYLKTQNYHWHVKGPQFKSLHELFEEQYKGLADAVDAIAERIVIKGHKAPASFKEFEALKRLKDGNSSLDSHQMLAELAEDHNTLLHDLNQALSFAQAHNDEGTVTLLADRVADHEKARWMLFSSR